MCISPVSTPTTSRALAMSAAASRSEVAPVASTRPSPAPARIAAAAS